VMKSAELHIEDLDDKGQRALLVLHIGGPKCGSSSLQTFLTSNPLLETIRGVKVHYWQVRVDEKATLIFEPATVEKKLRGLRYQNSGSLKLNLEKNCIHEIFDSFVVNNSLNDDKIFVFSSELWSEEFQSLNLASCKCAKTNFDILIYCHVRPQINLVGSTYLQWILWSDNPSLRESFLKLTQISDWEIQAQNSYKLGADKVLVRHSKDIVTDFCEAIGVDESTIKNPLTKRINSTLPLEAVALLVRNRQLRSGPHDSEIDFVLEEILAEMDYLLTPIELEINSDLRIEIEDYFRDNNIKLLARMRPDQAESFKLGIASSAKKFSDGIEVETLATPDLGIDFLEKITVSLLSDIKRNNQLFSSELSKRDNAMAAERDSLITERDSLITERDSLLTSKSWRLTRPFRAVIAWVKQH